MPTSSPSLLARYLNSYASVIAASYSSCDLPSMESFQLATPRACDGCTMCCKVMSIDELEKPEGVWCTYCAVGRGCKIYSERPPSCQAFQCGYLMMPGMGEHWFPARSKMVVTAENEGQIVIRADDSRPNAWKSEPFYSELKSMAASLGSSHQILVRTGGRTIAIVPDRDIDLGIVSDDHRLVTLEYPSPFGARWEVAKIDADDPLIAGKPINWQP